MIMRVVSDREMQVERAVIGLCGIAVATTGMFFLVGESSRSAFISAFGAIQVAGGISWLVAAATDRRESDAVVALTAGVVARMSVATASIAAVLALVCVLAVVALVLRRRSLWFALLLFAGFVVASFATPTGPSSGHGGTA